MKYLILTIPYLICFNQLFAEDFYKSETLVIQEITDGVYKHVSFLETESWGKVPCNGMIYVVNGEAIVLDTTPDDSSSLELINVIEEKLNAKVKYLVINHFHNDCLGGVNAFENNNVKIICHEKTKELANKNNINFEAITFNDEYIIEIGEQKIINSYFGEAHTSDNIISYLPVEKALFGGCLIKEVGAGKGNLADANVNAWSFTVKKIKLKYPEIIYVIPGHGKHGGSELLDYTMKMFE